MREIRSAVAKAKPGAWQSRYGDWLNIYAPFRKLTFTTLDAQGQLIHYTTFVYREYEMSAEIARIAKATDEAGNLAFSRCRNSAPNNEPVEGKIEKGTPIYAVDSRGDLLWYNHSGFQNGDAVWANNGGAKKVGYEWAGNAKVFKGDPRGKDGVVYAVSKEGYLAWYKHNGHASGSTEWINGKNVGAGFNGRFVFSGGDGVIYLIDGAGEIYWYKHLGYATGDKSWANNGTGVKVSGATAANWKNAQFVFAGGDGVIYLIDNRGDLYWNKHLGFRDGTARWSEQKKIGNGW